MAEVHIVDIDSEQWDIKDAPLTLRVNELEDSVELLKLKSLKTKVYTWNKTVATTYSTGEGAISKDVVNIGSITVERDTLAIVALNNVFFNIQSAGYNFIQFIRTNHGDYGTFYNGANIMTQQNYCGVTFLQLRKGVNNIIWTARTSGGKNVTIPATPYEETRCTLFYLE